MANPMADFVGCEEDRAHQLYHHYRNRFGKSYNTEVEMEHRKHTFTHNMRCGSLCEQHGFVTERLGEERPAYWLAKP